MIIAEKLAQLVNSTDNKYFVYVSESDRNLRLTHNNLVSLCNFSKSTSRPILTMPEGIPLILQPLSAVYADRGQFTEGELREALKVEGDVPFFWVDPRSQDVED